VDKSVSTLCTIVRKVIPCKLLRREAIEVLNERRMPNLGITKEEAIALVAFLKHVSAIDTNGFPRNFSINAKRIEGGTYAK